MNREMPRLVAAAALGGAVAMGLGAMAAGVPKHRPLPADTCEAVYELRSDISNLDLRLLDLDDIRNDLRRLGDLDSKVDAIAADVGSIKIDLMYRR